MSPSALGTRLLRYMFWCHRRPERSFFYKGRQFPVCARCTGIFAGYLVGGYVVLAVSGTHPLAGLLCMAPLAIDGGVQLYTAYESTNLRRFFTGILAGIGLLLLLEVFFVLGFSSGQWIKQWLLSLCNIFLR